MTGQDFQDKFEALYADLQANKSKAVYVMLRNSDNEPQIFRLSSDAQGVVNDMERENLQAAINRLKPFADALAVESIPVSQASEAFRLAGVPHETLRIAAQNANAALRDALAADADYQAAKTALDDARNAPAYVAASGNYDAENVAENYAQIQNAKGEYSDE